MKDLFLKCEPVAPEVSKVPGKETIELQDRGVAVAIVGDFKFGGIGIQERQLAATLASSFATLKLLGELHDVAGRLLGDEYKTSPLAEDVSGVLDKVRKEAANG